VDLRDFLLALIPMFVAIDAIGILPVYISFTEDTPREERRQVVRQSMITAFVVAIGFMAVGKLIFHAIGITVSDFKIAGGIILLTLAIHDLIFPEKVRRTTMDLVGVVPLGVPLIVGPAVLATILVIVDLYGYPAAVFSLVVNLLFVWLVFSRAANIIEKLGKGGTRAVAKVTSVLLAAIAVMLIRRGIMELLRT
jgi:multiple antibiotic resistance protein